MTRKVNQGLQQSIIEVMQLVVESFWRTNQETAQRLRVVIKGDLIFRGERRIAPYSNLWLG